MLIILNSKKQKALLLASLRDKREEFQKNDPVYWSAEIKTINQLIDEVR